MRSHLLIAVSKQCMSPVMAVRTGGIEDDDTDIFWLQIPVFFKLTHNLYY